MDKTPVAFDSVEPAHQLDCFEEVLSALKRLKAEAVHYRDSGVGKQFLNAAIDKARRAINKAEGW